MSLPHCERKYVIFHFHEKWIDFHYTKTESSAYFTHNRHSSNTFHQWKCVIFAIFFLSVTYTSRVLRVKSELKPLKRRNAVDTDAYTNERRGKNLRSKAHRLMKIQISIFSIYIIYVRENWIDLA